MPEFHVAISIQSDLWQLGCEFHDVDVQDVEIQDVEVQDVEVSRR
jgi:hypothetical protein